MARNFDGPDAVTEYLQVDATPVTGYPLTVSAWVYPTNTNTYKEVISIVDKDDPNQWLVRLAMSNTAVVSLFARDSATNDGQAVSTTTYSANTWHHIAGTLTASGRAAFLNGANKGTNAVAKAPTGIDRIAIGRAGDSTPSDPFQGRIAEVAVWNVELSDGEIASLARRVSPKKVRPQSLVLHYSLFGNGSPEPNLAGAGSTYNLTMTGTVSQADHPPVMPPFGISSGWFGTSGGGGVEPPAETTPHRLLMMGIGI